MDEFESNLTEGMAGIQAIENIASATPVQEPGLRNGLENLITAYTNINPQGISKPALIEESKKAIGAIHYHKTYKHLPGNLETLWKNTAIPKIEKYRLLLPPVETLGGAYGVKGTIDQGVKKTLDDTIKDYIALGKGEGSDSLMETLAKEMVDEDITKIKAEMTDEPMEKPEENDYRKFMTEFIKNHKGLGYVKGKLLKQNSAKADKIMTDNEAAIVDYTKSIADGVYKEGRDADGNSDLMRNYEKFASLGKTINQMTNTINAYQKMMQQAGGYMTEE